MSDACIDAAVNQLTRSTPECPLGFTGIQCVGGKLRDSSAPVGLTQYDFEFICVLSWTDPAAHAAALQYKDLILEEMRPFGVLINAYVNFIDTAPEASLHAEPAVMVGGKENLKRLKEVKQRVDPGNMFCGNPFEKLFKSEF